MTMAKEEYAILRASGMISQSIRTHLRKTGHILAFVMRTRSKTPGEDLQPFDVLSGNEA